MRFMMFIKVQSGDENFEPTAEDVAAMGRYNEELTKAGVLLALDGLQPPSQGAVVTFGAGGAPSVVDGPFAEAKEVIGGYWTIQVKDRDEAIEWAKRIPAQEGTTIELRRVFELSARPPEQTSAQ